MNLTLLKPAVILGTALLCAPPLFAQVKTDPRLVAPKAAAPVTIPNAPKPPAAPGLPGATTGSGFSDPFSTGGVPNANAPRKLKVLNVPPSELDSAVHFLQETLQSNGLEQLNILFGPDTRALEVSSVILHNVTGPDALQLIAAQAGCTVEPMHSAESPIPAGAGGASWGVTSVIGYQLRAKPKPTVTPPGMSQAPLGMSGFAMNPLAGRPAPATSPASRQTRIYPLGAVTTATKFPDLEKTLRDTFKADNVAENQVSLALHEKTNVLVVNAAEPVHALVEQLLTALNTNASQAERLNSARDRAMGREELESSIRSQKRLLDELAERDAQLRELHKELRKLQAAGQKSPSAK